MDSNQRAARAMQLKEDPIFREVMDSLKEDAFKAFSRSKSSETAQREFSWMMVRVIDRIEDGLQAIIDDQHISAAALVRAPE